ncbi:MAG: serine/threonine protein kinase, partial [Phycisphaerales bacterium]|nr:serine/threonine protein kinase [Phycisphaerales bacterium]
VALKIIKPGMDTGQVIARFAAERQALALMDHPNIARVLEAGATENGRPYFVMERVQGESITQFCDREGLTVPQRLKLMRSVCLAVQHAHQKGIIHRDLKPSNIMVGANDDRSYTVKVIDFGIAKAVTGRLTDRSLTGLHQPIGTPDYMSPEQLLLDQPDIDTRSDVYSLGVVLFELLTSSLPFDRRHSTARADDAGRRLACNVQPPRPSAKLGMRADSAAYVAGEAALNAHRPIEGSSVLEVASRRRTAPATLVRALRRDLDWIVLKCLETDRSRRYSSAVALADDIDRYLADEPVMATPPSASYRLRKFARRNRAALVAVATVSLALIVAVAGLAFGLVQARAGQREAKARAEELEQVARFQEAQLSGIDVQTMGVRLRGDLLTNARAAIQRQRLPPHEVEARVAQLEKLIAGSDFTGLALGTLRETVFERTLAAIDEQFSDQPLVQARLCQAAATTLRELGLLEAARRPQETALATRMRLLGATDTDTLVSQNEYGTLLSAQGEHDAALAVFRQGLKDCLQANGADHVDTLSFVNNIAHMLALQGRWAEALPMMQEVIQKRRARGYDESRDMLRTRTNLAQILRSLGRLEEADEVARDVLEIRRRVLGDLDPDTLASITALGTTLMDRGDLVGAEPYLRESLEKRRLVQGDDHPDTLRSLAFLGSLLLNKGDLPEAERCYREALDRQRRILGDEHENTISTLAWLGSLLKAQGRFTEASAYIDEALAHSRKVFGEEHPSTLYSLVQECAILRDLERLPEAETLCREAVAKCQSRLGDRHRDTITAVGILGSVLFRLGRLEESEQYLRQALTLSRQFYGDEHPGTQVAASNLGALLHRVGRLSEAEPYLRDALAVLRRTLAPDHPYVLNSTVSLASLLCDLDKAGEAAELLRPVEAAARRVLVGDHAVRLGSFLTVLGRARTERGEFEAAEQDLNEAHTILSGAGSGSADLREDCLEALAELYETWHTLSPGDGHDERAMHWREKLRAGQTTMQPAPH